MTSRAYTFEPGDGTRYRLILTPIDGAVANIMGGGDILATMYDTAKGRWVSWPVYIDGVEPGYLREKTGLTRYEVRVYAEAINAMLTEDRYNA